MREANVAERLIETHDRAPVHLLMPAVAAVHPHHGCSSPYAAENVRVLRAPRPSTRRAAAVIGMKAMAERVADHFVSHHAGVPRPSETKQAWLATGRLEHGQHGADRRPGVTFASLCMTALPDDAKRQIRALLFHEHRSLRRRAAAGVLLRWTTDESQVLASALAPFRSRILEPELVVASSLGVALRCRGRCLRSPSRATAGRGALRAVSLWRGRG